MTSGRTVVLVGCGSAKLDEEARAADLYTSNYFQLKRDYAEIVGDNWRILSAEHGLIHPTQRTLPYDTTIGDLTDVELEEWSETVFADVISLVRDVSTGFTPRFVGKWIVLAGQDYIDPLKDPIFSNAGFDGEWIFPFQQHGFAGIGEQMAWLRQQIELHQRSDASLEAFAGGVADD